MSEGPQNSSQEESIAGIGPIARPPFQLRSLPLKYRWEVSRRHPYYQIFWKTASQYHRREPVVSPDDELLRLGAITWLSAIGISADPPDPRTPFAALEADQLKPAWLSGAVHPITFRKMASLLLAVLPKDTLGDLSNLLIAASLPDAPNDIPGRIAALQDLQRVEDEHLDRYPDEPLVSVNPGSSERQITEAIHALLQEWKEERGLSDQRVRLDKFEEYLDVWDRREGWHDGGYDRGQELLLRDVAKRVQRPLATVSSQYRSAFELISGHSYSPPLWFSLFGVLKLSDFAALAPGIVSKRRPLKSPTPQAVPESALIPPDRIVAPGAASAIPGVAGDLAFFELLSDIDSLIADGRSDEEIVTELELSKEYVHVIASIRERQAGSAA
jgi:hypothetical protein